MCAARQGLTPRSFLSSSFLCSGLYPCGKQEQQRTPKEEYRGIRLSTVGWVPGKADTLGTWFLDMGRDLAFLFLDLPCSAKLYYTVFHFSEVLVFEYLIGCVPFLVGRLEWLGTCASARPPLQCWLPVPVSLVLSKMECTPGWSVRHAAIRICPASLSRPSGAEFWSVSLSLSLPA